MAKLSSPPNSKTHTWILVLLFWVIALLVFIAAYLLYGKGDETAVLSGAELATQCTAAGFVDATTVDDDEEPAECPEPEDGEVEATASRPGFTYPNGWHVFGRAQFNATDLQTIVYVTPEPVFLCADCDIIIPGVTMTTQSNVHAASYLAEFTDEDLGAYANITMTTETRSNGTLTIVEGNTTENAFGGPGILEVYIFVGETQMAIAHFSDLDSVSEDDVDPADWDLIKNSLDFSKIE